MTWAIFRNAHIEAIGELFPQAHPRVITIVGGALLEETLHRTLSERLRDDNNTQKKLLRPIGPLGNAGTKNDLLYMLRAYDKKTWKALEGLITIRNFFAHNLDASFDSTAREFEEAMNKLTLHEGSKYYPLAKAQTGIPADSTNEIEQVINNRVKFIVNLKLALIALMRDRLSHERWSSAPRNSAP